MGLNSTWDDSTQCNKNVPPLNQPFPYGKQPFRGVDLGGMSKRCLYMPAMSTNISLQVGLFWNHSSHRPFSITQIVQELWMNIPFVNI